MSPRKTPRSEDLGDSQKRFAEHVGQKTGISPESIEKGVEDLITRSQPEKERYSPPYGNPIWYEKIFDIAQTRRLDTVDLEFISINVVGSRNEYKVLRGLRFLGLVDENCRATERLDSLRVIGDVFKERLGAIVHDAYKELFSKIVLQKARAETLVNYFMQRYDYGETTAREATSVFIMLCKKSGISLPQELETRKTSSTLRTAGTKSVPRKTYRSTAKEETPISDLAELKMGDILIQLPKNDRNAALKAKRLLELYIEGLENPNPE